MNWKVYCDGLYKVCVFVAVTLNVLMRAADMFTYWLVFDYMIF